MAVDVVYDAAPASQRLAVNDYDVLVLDRDLPERHGDELCRELVQSGARTRVLMLTAAASVPERVAGLGLGADDYLPKPFDYAELVARVQALGRRSQAPVPPLLTYRDVVLDTPRMQGVRGGAPPPCTRLCAGSAAAAPPGRRAFGDALFRALSRKEFAVLEVLMRAS